MLTAEDKRCVRTIIRKVHPDRFGSHPNEQATNSESLKELNAFLESFVTGQVVRSSAIAFWVKDEGTDGLHRVHVELSSRKSLHALFDAFGVEHALPRPTGASSDDGSDDASFVSYLRDRIGEALALSERFEALRASCARSRKAVVAAHGLEDVRFEDVVGDASESLVWQIAALQSLSEALDALDVAGRRAFSAQRIVLHRRRERTHAAVRDGEVHLVANRTLKAQIRRIDAGLLATLSEVNAYWSRRMQVRSRRPPYPAFTLPAHSHARARLAPADAPTLSPPLPAALRGARPQELLPRTRTVLGCKAVLSDWGYSEDGVSASSAECVVLWAGKVLKSREAFEAALQAVDSRRRTEEAGGEEEREGEGEEGAGSQGGGFRFSVLVHSDGSRPDVEAAPSSTMLQVRWDCPPATLLSFLCSDAAVAFSDAVGAREAAREGELRLLGRVRRALRLKQCIRVTVSEDGSAFQGACERLILNAGRILQAVDLRGVSFAIDDCFEVWESGFVSIPCDFDLDDLCESLVAALPEGKPAKRKGQASLPPETELPGTRTGAGAEGRDGVEAEPPTQAKAQAAARRGASASALVAVRRGRGQRGREAGMVRRHLGRSFAGGVLRGLLRGR